jgi:histidinol-phosphate aminotransferase
MSAEERRSRVAQWLRPALLAQHAYPVAPAEGLIKLDAMENPYPWPAALVDDWLQCLRQVPVNRYPDAAGAAVKSALREAWKVPQDLSMVLGNGSDELIQLLAIAFSGPQRTMLAPDPSFVLYRMVAEALDIRYVSVPLADDFALNAEAMLAAIERDEPALVFIAYPNNPTGNLFDAAAIREIVRAAPGVVVLDEAYYPFAGKSFLAETTNYPNLIVMRTLSKMGFAGLRLGVLLAHPEWGAEFEKLRLPYNINSLTQVTVEFALRHRQTFDEQAAAIRDAREQLRTALGDLPGLRVYASAANFLLVRTPAALGDLHAGLREQGVLVKDLHGMYPTTQHCLRISVGTAQENAALVQALTTLLPAA